MINTETVFVLGAGASHPYGFPLGERLVSNMIINLHDDHQIGYLVKYGFEDGLIRKFGEKLKGSNLKSIDAFLEHQNNDFKVFGKVAIAQELTKYTAYDTINGSDDWYKEIWNSMYTAPELVAQNKISFISFNYDLSLEHYLYQSIASTFDLTEEQSSQIFSSFNIVHLHGKLSVEPWDKSYKPKIDIVQAAEGIKIISDEIVDDKDFVKAHQLLAKAKRIYFLGFGYHRVNVERLKVKELSLDQTIEGSGFGLTGLQCVQIDDLFGRHTTVSRSSHWNNREFIRQRVLLD